MEKKRLNHSKSASDRTSNGSTLLYGRLQVDDPHADEDDTIYSKPSVSQQLHHQRYSHH